MKNIATVMALSILLAVGARAQQGPNTESDPSKDQKTTDVKLPVKASTPALDATDEELKKKVEEMKSQLEGLDEAIKELQTDRDALKKIKVSGYLQINFEKSESVNGLSVDPYDAKDFVKSRFRVRRSRIKIMYDGGSTSMVVQGDYSNSGFSLKDAYLDFAEQSLKIFSFRFGVFNRPNYEVEYSSSQRESPERSRVIGALYPGERDLGVMVTMAPEDLFKLQLAAFNNTFAGTFSQNNPNFSSEPLYFMARVTKALNLGDVGIDFGVHGRFGSVRANSARLLESDVATNGAADTTSIKVGDAVSRNWFGAEVQLYYDFLGGMKLLAEYITGSDVNVLSATPGAIRKRDFNGYYAMLVKSLGDEFQFAVKYDSYNPNSKISSDVINSTSELAINTIGLGLHNYSFPNVRLTLWYDNVTTKTNDRILKEDPKDNLLTFRAQYKF